MLHPTKSYRESCNTLANTAGNTASCSEHTTECVLKQSHGAFSQALAEILRALDQTLFNTKTDRI